MPAADRLLAKYKNNKIPIVVAMDAQQNVAGALSGGPAAILAGLAAVSMSFALVPVLDRLGRKDEVVGAAEAKPAASAPAAAPVATPATSSAQR